MKLVIAEQGAENISGDVISVGSFDDGVMRTGNTGTSSLGPSTVVASLLGIVPGAAILFSEEASGWAVRWVDSDDVQWVYGVISLRQSARIVDH